MMLIVIAILIFVGFYSLEGKLERIYKELQKLQKPREKNDS